MQSMLQATVCDGVAFDALTLGQDFRGSAEVDVSRGQIVDALVIADMIVMFDEGGDLPLGMASSVVDDRDLEVVGQRDLR